MCIFSCCCLFNTGFIIFISTICNLLFRVWSCFNQFYEIALLYEPEAIRNNAWISIQWQSWIMLFQLRLANEWGCHPITWSHRFHFGCWNCVQMNGNTCLSVSGEQRGPLLALGMLPGKIQWSRVFVHEQNIFKG